MNANCRRCFKTIFAGSTRCPSCGASQAIYKSPEEKRRQAERQREREDRKRVSMLQKELEAIS